MTDKERLDWLDSLTTFSWDSRRDPFVDSPTFDQIIERILFTIPSQHVKAANLREAIDAAIEKAKLPK